MWSSLGFKQGQYIYNSIILGVLIIWLLLQPAVEESLDGFYWQYYKAAAIVCTERSEKS